MTGVVTDRRGRQWLITVGTTPAGGVEAIAAARTELNGSWSGPWRDAVHVDWSGELWFLSDFDHAPAIVISELLEEWHRACEREYI